MTGIARRWSPWSAGDGIRALIIAVAGHGVWLAGWWMAAREPAFDRQMPAVNVAVLGVVVVAYADLSWLRRAHRRIVDRRRALLSSEAVGSPVPSVAPGLIVAGPELDLYHRPVCPFATGRGWTPVSHEAAAGRRPCGVCRP